MRKLLITCLLACSVLVVHAQETAFGKLFAHYSGREGYTSMELGEKMMKMMSRRARDEDKALADLLDGIRSIRIVAAKHPNEQFVSDLLEIAGSGKYKLILSQTEGEQNSRFYFIDGGRFGYSEFLMVVYGPKEQVAVDIYGVFDVKDISRLSAIRPM